MSGNSIAKKTGWSLGIIFRFKFLLFINTISGGISLLSSSLMPYRTLLTSCDDMNIYIVPLYRSHGGKSRKSYWHFVAEKRGNPFTDRNSLESAGNGIASGF